MFIATLHKFLTKVAAPAAMGVDAEVPLKNEVAVSLAADEVTNSVGARISGLIWSDRPSPGTLLDQKVPSDVRTPPTDMTNSPSAGDSVSDT